MLDLETRELEQKQNNNKKTQQGGDKERSSTRHADKSRVFSAFSQAELAIYSFPCRISIKYPCDLPLLTAGNMQIPFC